MDTTPKRENLGINQKMEIHPNLIEFIYSIFKGIKVIPIGKEENTI